MEQNLHPELDSTIEVEDRQCKLLLLMLADSLNMKLPELKRAIQMNMLPDNLMRERYVSMKTVAEVLGMDARTVRRYVKAGILPKPLRIDNNVTRFNLRETIQSLKDHSASLEN